VILATFRTNGLLLAAGDVLAAEEGLSAARWQVLGAIALADRELTVPQVARRMGLTRQSVHATVKRLVTDGLIEYASNEDHRRSPFVRLTAVGSEKFSQLRRVQANWVNELAAGLSVEELETTSRVLRSLCRRLETGSGSDADGGGGSTRTAHAGAGRG
jgi:DNA-binding MarR family transcriptional regulator